MRRVKYVLDGHVLIPKGRFSALVPDLLPTDTKGDVPAHDYTYQTHVTLLMDFANNWIRKETRAEEFFASETEIYFYPTFKVEIFDGENIQVYKPRKANTSARRTPYPYEPELRLNDQGYFKFFVQFSDEPLLFAHGKFPRSDGPTKFERLRLPVGAEMFRWHANTVHDGRACIVLRTPPLATLNEVFFEYWVDPERQGAVMRCSKFIGGEERERLDITHQDTPDGWLPATWACTQTRRGGDLDRREELRVVEYLANPRLERANFQVQPTPGMIVYDQKTNTRYAFGGPGKEDVDVKVLAAAGTNGRGERQRLVAWSLLFVLSLVLVIIVLRTIVTRKWR